MRKTPIVAMVAFVLVSMDAIALSRHSLSVAAEPTTAAIPDADLQEKAFKDARSGIELRLPKGWVKKKGIKDTGFQAPAKDRVQAGGLAPNIILSQDAASGIKPSDVDAVIAGKRKQYAKLFPGYKDEAASSTPPHVAEKGVGRIDFSYVVANVLRVRSTQIWIIDNDKIYIVTCLSLDDTYAKNAKIFDAVVDTVGVP